MLLHAIVQAEDSVDPKGMVQVFSGRLCAYVSDVEVDMLRHHRLVEWVHAASGSCLPVRFPTHVDSTGALQQLLEKREAELLKALEHVRGRSELAVTAVWTEAQQPATGRSYLHTRQREFALAERIERELAPLVVESQARAAPRAGVAASVAVLVERDTADGVKAKAQQLEAGGDVRILVNGPWPPYSFARLGMGEE